MGDLDKESAIYYRAELLAAIDLHLRGIEDCKEGTPWKIQMFCNKALSLIQFGLKTKLITDAEFHETYRQLEVARNL